MRQLSVVFLAGCGLLAGAALPPGHVDNFSGHPRLIVMSDIGNEPDDQMSLVRLLLYSNQLDIEALIASTSTWQKTAVHPETMRALIHAYGQVRPNLLLHAKGWPLAEDLDARVFTGQSVYGMAATGVDKMSEGAEAVIRVVDRDDSRPVWISVWGGANTLAQALLRVRATRSPADVERFVEKLRVYSISDQDDAGPWIRREFPNLFYIVAPSTPTSSEYYYATWTGISGDVYYRNCAGANGETVTNEWLETNIRAKGPLGKVYPRFAFIMEGDTPAYLGLIDNGLNAYRRPDWGGWGGRYIYRQPYGETHPLWTQGGDLFSRVTSQDTVAGTDGKPVTSDQATIWRWRDAFQHDFAARMDWTIADYAHANHNPLVEVNGQSGTAPIVMDAEVGKPVTLDASRSQDPDGQALTYAWFHYAEAGSTGTSPAAVTIVGADTSKAIVTPIDTCRPAWLPGVRPCSAAGTAHIILAVTDNGSPRLTSYRRIILNVHARTFEDLARLFEYNRSMPAHEQTKLREERPGVQIYDYSFAGDGDGHVPGLLVVPVATGKHPVILYGHWMMNGSPLRNKGEFLEEAVVMARAGAVCLLLDSPLVREGVIEDPDPMHGQGPNAAVTMVREWRRALDLLLARPDVDAERVAYVGHSFNAGVGAKLTGVEKRIGSFVLMASEYSLRDFIYDAQNPEMVAMRKKVSDEWISKYLATFPWEDSLLFVEHSAPAAVFLQFGSADKPISERVARIGFAHFAEPKRIGFYDAGHELNTAARRDRTQWLKERLNLTALDVDALERIAPLK